MLHESLGDVPGMGRGAVLGQVPVRRNAGAMPGAIVGKEEMDVLPSPSLTKAVQLRATLVSFLATAFIRILSVLFSH